MIAVMRLRVAGVLVVVAVFAALVPVDEAWVEAHYARTWYPELQRRLTAASNAVPFAALDVLVVAAMVGCVLAAVALVRAPRGTRVRRLGERARQGVFLAALGYLAFLGVWGCNYRRQPVSAWVDFDEARVTAAAVVGLNDIAVMEMGRLRGRLPERLTGWQNRDAVARSLRPALERGTQLLHLPAPVCAGHPKTSLLDPFFTRAGVSGMTDPFFLETLLASNVLPFEEPAVMAHEWGHLAGLARESDASFFGLIVCLHGDVAAQYSAWLEMFTQTLAGRDGDERREVLERLPALVRADLDAIARRTERDQVRVVSLAAWRSYDKYLRSNRVASGVRNYSEVVRLMAGTRFAPGWAPVVRPQD